MHKTIQSRFLVSCLGFFLKNRSTFYTKDIPDDQNYFGNERVFKQVFFQEVTLPCSSVFDRFESDNPRRPIW